MKILIWVRQLLVLAQHCRTLQRFKNVFVYSWCVHFIYSPKVSGPAGTKCSCSMHNNNYYILPDTSLYAICSCMKMCLTDVLFGEGRLCVMRKTTSIRRWWLYSRTYIAKTCGPVSSIGVCGK